MWTNLNSTKSTTVTPGMSEISNEMLPGLYIDKKSKINQNSNKQGSYHTFIKDR